eukprot:1176799-Prorocentrum_minimum.AAC.3
MPLLQPEEGSLREICQSVGSSSGAGRSGRRWSHNRLHFCSDLWAQQVNITTRHNQSYAPICRGRQSTLHQPYTYSRGQIFRRDSF